MFEDMILEDLAKRKLTLFKLLLQYNDHTYSVNFFENKLDYSYSRVVYLLESIQQDILAITGESLTLVDSKGVHPKINITYDQYYQYLLIESVPYQLLVSILYSAEDDLEAFCKKQFLSRASVIRKTRLMVAYFKKFNVKLNSSRLTLTGNERLVRLLLYQLIWFCSQGSHVPRKPSLIDYEDVVRIISPYFPDSHSYSAKRQIYLSLDIVYLRVKAGHILKEKTAIPPYLPIDLDYAAIFFKDVITNPTWLEAEAEFSAFLLTRSPNYFRPTDFRLSFLQNYLATEKNQATLILNEFCTFYSSEIMANQIDITSRKVLFGNIANMIFSVSILQKPFPTIFHLVSDQSLATNKSFIELNTQFKAFFTKISKRKNFHWIKGNIKQLSEGLACLLLPQYESLQKEDFLDVALIAESNFLITQQLTNFLNDLSFVRLTAFVQEDYSDTDFIVSTSTFNLPLNTELPSFVFHLSSDNGQYIDLYQKLRETQLEKKRIGPAKHNNS